MPAFPCGIKLGMQHRVDLQTAARRNWNKTLRLQGSRMRCIFAHRLVDTPWKRRLRVNLSCVQWLWSLAAEGAGIGECGCIFTIESARHCVFLDSESGPAAVPASVSSSSASSPCTSMTRSPAFSRVFRLQALTPFQTACIMCQHISYILPRCSELTYKNVRMPMRTTVQLILSSLSRPVPCLALPPPPPTIFLMLYHCHGDIAKAAFANPRSPKEANPFRICSIQVNSSSSSSTKIGSRSVVNGFDVNVPTGSM